MLDLLIRDGQLVDGTGATRRHADVGIRDGRIVAVGEVDEPAAHTVSADGAIVAPGFIDPHTHYDAQVFWEPSLTPSCLHGFTTMIGGNCGFTIAPLNAESTEYLMTMLARVEGMPLPSLEAGVPWDWTTTEQFLARLDGHVGVNVGFLVGHSTIRRVVMGEAACEREARPDELSAMKDLLRQGLAAGGLGFSSSLAPTHSDANGDPVPSRHASFEELLELAAVCGEFEGTSLELVPYTGSVFPERITDLMIEMSARAGRVLNWNSIHAKPGNRDEVEAKLAISDRARAAGGSVVGLVIPMESGLRLNLVTGFVLDMLPGWDKLMALPAREKLALFADRSQRARLLAESQSDPRTSHLARWETYLVYDGCTPETRKYEGSTVGAIAAAEGKEPFDALLDIVVTDELQTTFGRPETVDTAADWEARARVLRDPRAVVGASDAGAHLDMIDSFRYPTHLLAKGVREFGVVTTEEAVHLITQVPAELYGMRDRGVVREGAAADVVIFDEATVGSGPLQTRFDLPSGAGRLFAESTGVASVIVNGRAIVDDGRLCGEMPGRVLRAGIDTHTAALR